MRGVGLLRLLRVLRDTFSQYFRGWTCSATPGNNFRSFATAFSIEARVCVYDFTYFSNIRRNLHQSVTDWCRFSPYIWPRGPTMREFFLTPSPVVGLLPTHSSQQWLRRLVWYVPVEFQVAASGLTNRTCCE